MRRRSHHHANPSRHNPERGIMGLIIEAFSNSFPSSPTTCPFTITPRRSLTSDFTLVPSVLMSPATKALA
jgi:hypothetical protein